MKLHLGVVDIPYVTALSNEQKRTLRWRFKKRPWQGLAATQTTGDVAQILESRYGVMETYYKLHQQDVVREMENRLKGVLDNVLTGKPGGNEEQDVFGDLSGIEQGFRDAIDRREFDGKIAGVPTQAAERGVNLRLAHPYAKGNPSRPSFFRSGLYYQSFKAWVEK